MLKNTLVSIALMFLCVAPAHAACDPYYTPQYEAELLTYLDNNRPELRNVRALISDDSQSGYLSDERRAQISTTTHRLEYWAKDIARYIRNYSKTHPDKVCERVTVVDKKHMGDFVWLTGFYSKRPNSAPINYEDYK